MFVLPVGHDKGIYRFPYLTLGVMALCAGLQLYASFVPPHVGLSEAQQLEFERLETEIWLTDGPAWIATHYPALAAAPQSASEVLGRTPLMRRARRGFFHAYGAGRVVSADNPLLHQWRDLMAQSKLAHGTLKLAYRPGGPAYGLVSYAFVHEGWLHLVFNLLFLYLCGCNLEDRWGRPLWALLYLSGAAAAALGWTHLHPGASRLLVGASGAVAAAMGAFLVAYYDARIRFVYTIRLHGGSFTMKAYWALPLWLLLQGLGVSAERSGFAFVAYSAHVAGFVFGAAFALLLRLTSIDRILCERAEQSATDVQDRALERAYEALEAGERELARARFSAITRDRPTELQPALELYRLSDDPSQRSELGPLVIRLARQEQDWHTALQVYVELQQSEGDQVLDDRTLFALGECFERAENRGGALLAFSRIVEQHPDSALRPRAWLNLARTQNDEHRPDLARASYQALIERYPDTAFAEQASAALAKLPDPAAARQWGIGQLPPDPSERELD